ncbi:MAG: hypothetical protein HGA87_01995 [Desulfobulbaceae bacterium]|nr:hypothetical protein [Desulfobulbaceae bacterium]
MNKPKKRNETITATTVVTDSISVDYDPSTDSLIFNEADTATVKSQVTYTRVSGKEKVLTVSPRREKAASFNQTRNLKASVDYLCAIDTNTKVINNVKVSVSVIYQVPGILKNHTRDIPLIYLCSYLITGVKEGVNPEVIGWHLFLNNKIQLDHFKNQRRLGLVVDSELAKLDAINAIKVPYYKNYFLPKFVTLIYASTDSGKENIANQLLSYCDKGAGMVLEHVQRNQLIIPNLKNGNEDFSGFCEIRNKSN